MGRWEENEINWDEFPEPDPDPGALVPYLIDLAADESGTLLRLFRANPERAMRVAGLTWQDRDLIHKHDLQAVRNRLAAEAGGQFAVMICPPTICPPTIC